MGNATTLNEEQAEALTEKHADEALNNWLGEYLKTHAPEVWYSIYVPGQNSRRALLLRLKAAVERALEGTP